MRFVGCPLPEPYSLQPQEVLCRVAHSPGPGLPLRIQKFFPLAAGIMDGAPLAGYQRR